MHTKKVIVVPYDPQWPQDFQNIQQEVQSVLGDLALRIEHVGSTSVPGLAAKPIIDLDVVIKDYSVFTEVVFRLANAGYLHEGDLGIQNREAFCYEGKEHLRKHHLYVCPEFSEELRRHVAFRDHLHSHPEDARRYGQVKIEAARHWPDSIDRYLEEKRPIIAQLYVKCGL